MRGVGLLVTALGVGYAGCFLSVPATDTPVTGRVPASLEELMDTTVLDGVRCNARIYNNSIADVSYVYEYGELTDSGFLAAGTYINISMLCTQDSFVVSIFSEKDLIAKATVLQSVLSPTRVKLFLVLPRRIVIPLRRGGGRLSSSGP